jgi:hypothetical protein
VGASATLDDVEKKILGPTGTRIPSPRSSSPYPVAIPTTLSRLLLSERRKYDFQANPATQNTVRSEAEANFRDPVCSI